MPKIAEEKTDLWVRKRTDPGMHAVGGVTGLYLHIKDTGARSWILNATIGNKRREMGLGAYPTVTLQQAREAGRAALAKVRQGIDPVAEREALRDRLKAKQRNSLTFDQAVARYIPEKAAEWRSVEHRKQWAATLKTHASPIIGHLDVATINTADVLAVLQPIWTTIPETATRVQQRISRVLAWCITVGYRNEANPAIWKDHLSQALPNPTKIQKVESHAAMPLERLHELLATAMADPSATAQCLAFLVLTGCRTGEASGALRSELQMIDDMPVWRIGAERMKAGREHIVPLSKQAIAIVNRQPRVLGDDHLFYGQRTSGGRRDGGLMLRWLKDNGFEGTVHGLRGLFRTWLTENGCPWELAEFALAHTLKDKTAAAYVRSTYPEKRLEWMQRWADFLDAAPTKKVYEFPGPREAAA
jgi:integrase